MDCQSQTSFLNQCISLFMVTLKVFFVVFLKPYGLERPEGKYNHNILDTFWTKVLKDIKYDHA